MRSNIDWPSFVATVAIIVVSCGLLWLFPQTGAQLVEQAYQRISAHFSPLYLIMGTSALMLLLWLALSRFGRVVLGDGNEKPEFSLLSWSAMLFCSGVGAGLLYWAPLEWAYYYATPPFGLEPRSVAAAEWASSYGLFHWGPTAWALYCLPTIAIAYPFYVKKVPFLRLSTGCHYFFAGKNETKTERLIDWLFMIGLLGGTGTSLGLSTPMVAALVAGVMGWPHTFQLELAVVFSAIAIFSTSVWLGLAKGMKRLSNLNLILSFIFLMFVFLSGPTGHIVKASLNSIGVVMQNFIRMNTWSDPFTTSGFVESWTVFYWAWWIAYGPFVGIFVTRISRGRTIRQVIIGMLSLGSLGGALWYMILGNYAFHLELSGQLPVSSAIQSASGPATIYTILAQLPYANIATGVFVFIAMIFTATTYDSAAFSLAANATRKMQAGENPARWHRLFWAAALGLLPITLMFIGGVKVTQTATLIVSLPLILIYVLLSVALIKQLQMDDPR